MYLTREDIAAAVGKVELVQLSNDDGYGSAPDWEIIDRAIAYACELADGYLTGRYRLPLEPAPSILRPLCTDIARHWLHSRRINAAEFPKPLQLSYENALKVLANIRDGKIHLGVRDDADAPDQHRTFGVHKAVLGGLVGKQLDAVSGQLLPQVVAHGGEYRQGGSHQ